MKYLNFIIAIGSSLVILSSANAINDSPQTFTLDGQLFKAGSTEPLLDSNAVLKVQIISPNGTCLLYEEQQTVNTTATDGYFHINVGSLAGSAKRTTNDPGRSMNQIFQNYSSIAANSVPGQTCSGSAYMPVAGAVRYFRVTVTPSSSNTPDVLSPDIVIDSVPQAMIAQSVQGLERSSILQVATGASLALTQANLEAIFTTPAYTNLQAILAGNFMSQDSSGATLPSYASTPAGVSTGDMWFDSTTGQIKYQNSVGVQTVGTSTGGVTSLTLSSNISGNGTVAATISSGAASIDLSNTGVTPGSYAKVTVDAKGRVSAGISLAETDLPTIVTAGKVSGNAITSGTISGSAGINSSGNLISTGTISGLNVQATNLRVYNGSNYIEMTAPALGGNVNLTLPTTDGNPGEVLSTDGSGILSWISSAVTLAGDVSGPSGSTSVDKIKGKAVTAASVSGQMMIYNGTAWVNSVMSGDATMAYDGNLVLNKVPVSKGGTNSTSFGNNRIIASNGTGTALVDFTCPLNQVIAFDASGNAICSNVSSLFGAIINGGNTTGADISIGTNDNKALAFKVNNATAMIISQGGNIGIGVNPSSRKLDIQNTLTGTGNGTTNQVVTYTTPSGAQAATAKNIGLDVQNYGEGSNTTGKLIGIRGEANQDSGNNVISAIIGSHIESNKTTGGAVTEMVGSETQVNLWGGPSATNVIGSAISGDAGSGTVTNFYGLKIQNLSQSAGSVTNRYGVYLGSFSGSATSDYGIYQAGSAQNNYFAGNVGIGRTTASTALDISGAVTANGMSSAPSVSASNTGRIYYDYATNKFKVSQNGGAYQDLIAAGGAGDILNGGNTTGADISIGTKDNKALAFKVNDTVAMTISQSGNVGIGISPASYPLDVMGTGQVFKATQNGGAGQQVFSLARINHASQNNEWSYYISNGAGVLANGSLSVYPTTNADMSLDARNAGYKQLVLKASGNVGIGTTTPATALDVSGAITAEGMSSAPGLAGSNTGRIYYDYSANKFKVSQNGGAYVDLISSADSSGYVNGGNAFGGSASIGTTDNHSLSIKTNNATAMTISQGGNVGIGTTTPANPLDVNAARSIVQLTSTTGTNASYAKFTNSANSGYVGLTDNAGTWLLNPGAANALVITSNTAPIQFGINGSAVMTVLTSGNVGIGTATPSVPLEVVGTVQATDFVSTSDRRFKTDIVGIDNALEKIVQINGVTWKWLSNGETDMGVIAQDVEKVFPELVVTNALGKKSVKYGNLAGPLIEAVKTLKAEIDAFKSKIEKLQGEVDELKTIKAENEALKARLDRLEKRLEASDTKSESP